MSDTIESLKEKLRRMPERAEVYAKHRALREVHAWIAFSVAIIHICMKIEGEQTNMDLKWVIAIVLALSATAWAYWRAEKKALAKIKEECGER